MILSAYQINKMKSAKQGFCYDSNPTTWDNQHRRNEMEKLVKMGLMEKIKNHSGDRHGFYALTENGKKALVNL